MLINDVDLNELLQEDWKDHDSEFNWKKNLRTYNKTSFFALPMVGMTLDGNTCSRYMRNAYLEDRGIEHDFERPLFVLFRVKNPKERYWSDFSNAAPSKDNYITDYYVGQEGDVSLIMYVFQVPTKMADDFELFKQGRYSAMSDAYKKGFEQYTYSSSGNKQESRMWGILNKSEALKDEVTKRFIVPSTSKPEDVITLRRDMNNWDEVWDYPREEAEFYRNNYADTNNVG